MSRRLFALLVFGMLLAVAQPAAASFAQALPPTPGPLPNDPALTAPLPPAPATTGPIGFFADPGAWATTVFNSALVGLARSTSTDVVGLMGWLLGNGNVISQTPPLLSYDNGAVVKLWTALRGVANVGLAVVAAAGGLNVLVLPTRTLSVRLP